MLACLVCLSGVARAAAAQCVRPPAGMTGWWPADGDVADIVGSSPAILRGDAKTGDGFVGGAFLLDGDGDFVEVPDSPALDFGEGDFTVDLWVRFEALSREQVVIEKYVETMDSASPGWTLTKLSGGDFHLQLRGMFSVSSRDVDLVPNTWHHLAARRQGNVLSLLVDGVEFRETIEPVDLTSTSSLKLGHRGGPGDTPGSLDPRGFFLAGAVDEVEVFAGRALSNAEIRAIYAAGPAGKCKGDISEVPSLSGFGAAAAASALLAAMLLRLRAQRG